MKQFYLTGMFAAVVLLTACNKEEKFVPAPYEGILKATVETNRPSSRAGFTDDQEATFYWSKGDQIGVTTSGSPEHFSALDLVESSIGQTSGSFNGKVSGTIKGYAVYPFNEAHSISNTSMLNFNFKSVYKYTRVDTDFATPNPGEGNSFNPPMWGNISEGSVGLKHLGGVLCIKIDELPTGDNLELNLISDKKINGTYTVELTENNPEIKAVDASGNEGKVTIEFTNSTAGKTAGVFYIPVPVGNHTVRLKILDKNDNDKEKINTALGTFTITRQLLKRLELNDGSIEAGVRVEASTVAEIQNKLSESDYVALTGKTSDNNTISIPAIASENKTVALENIDSDITVSTAEGNQAIKNLTLFFTKNETLEKVPDLTLETPNTTSILQATTNDFEFGKVTASTAENTLIVGKGVKIGTLIVKKGNVRIQAGATVTNLEKSNDNPAEIVTIIREDGAKLPDTIPDCFTVISPAEYELRKTAADGGSIALTADVVLSSPLVVGKDMTLDLNGHQIKPINGALTQVLNTKDAVILVRRGATLTVNDSRNGSIDSEGNENIGATIKLTDKADGETGQPARLVVNGGSIKSEYFAISGNGTQDNTELEITGGTISSLQDYAIYSPQTGTTEISGGTISGAAGAIALQDGTLNISGPASLISKGTAQYDGAEGDGTKGLENAVVCVPARYGKCTVQISGGVFTSEGNSTTFSRTYRKMGGTYYNESSITVLGGTFSNLDQFGIDFRKYLADNANVNVKFNKDCSIPYWEFKQQHTSVTVDLNKHVLELTGGWSTDILNSSSLSFQNGTIQFTNKEGVFVVKGGSSLTVDRVQIHGSENYAFWVQGQDAELHIDNSEIEATITPITTNANIKNGELEYGSGAKIYLTHSRFTGQTGFMNNVPATVVIDHCQFFGNHQAALLRGGDYQITNSEFTLNAELENTHPDNKGLEMWGQNNEVAFAGITIGNHTADQTVYQYPTNVDMKNVQVTVQGTYAASFPALCACANTTDHKGVNITYDHECRFISPYTPNTEYGTINITVNGKPVVQDNNNKFVVDNAE